MITSTNEVKDMEDQQKHFDYLDELRESGVTNMFGAGPYLAKAFNLEEGEARRIVSAWMNQF